MKKRRRERNTGSERKDAIEAAPSVELRDCGANLWKDGRVDESPTIAVELARYRLVQALRDDLLVLCGKGKAVAKYPSLAFERWLMCGERHAGDVVIPSGRGPEHETLVEDLKRVGYSAQESVAKADSLASMVRQRLPLEASHLPISAHLKRHGSDWKCSGGAISFTLHADVMTRLESLYRGDRRKFETAVFVLCLRYSCIAGPGFQAATITPLESDAVELFASPFNCSGRVFGSRYRDTDSVFGSLGDAFEWFSRARENSQFEANPPFVLPILQRTVELIVETPGPFKMVLIVPKWENQPFYILLRRSFPDARTEVLDNRWIQPAKLENGKSAHLRVIPTDAVVWHIEKTK